MAVTTTTEDNTLYPTMIKVNQATELLNTLRIKLLQELGWTRVGTIVYQHDIAISVRADLLVHELHDSQIHSHMPHIQNDILTISFTRLRRRKFHFSQCYFRYLPSLLVSGDAVGPPHSVPDLLAGFSHVVSVGPFQSLGTTTPILHCVLRQRRVT